MEVSETLQVWQRMEEAVEFQIGDCTYLDVSICQISRIDEC